MRLACSKGSSKSVARAVLGPPLLKLLPQNYTTLASPYLTLVDRPWCWGGAGGAIVETPTPGRPECLSTTAWEATVRWGSSVLGLLASLEGLDNTAEEDLHWTPETPRDGEQGPVAPHTVLPSCEDMPAVVVSQRLLLV